MTLFLTERYTLEQIRRVIPHKEISEFVGIIRIKNIDLVEKKEMIGYWI
jgi:hypothetical protein